MMRSGSTPPKRAIHSVQVAKGAEQGFGRPYGKPHGLFAGLVENQTVRHSRAKSEGVLGIADPWGDDSPRPAVEALCPYGRSSCSFDDHRSSGKKEPYRRLRSEKPVCSEPWGFQYGLAKSRTGNPQVMGQAGNTCGNCRYSPPLPDELQRS